MDSYKSIANPVVGEFKDRGSRFIAHAFRVENEAQANEIVSNLRVEHHSARHCCFAWRLGLMGELQRVNDDGEPAGTAGRPILGQLLSADLTHILVVVVRYFGGTLLGVSGLINAYRQAALQALQAAQIVEIVVGAPLVVEVDYSQLNAVMRIVKRRGLESRTPEFCGERCTISIFVRSSLTEDVREELSKIEKATII